MKKVLLILFFAGIGVISLSAQPILVASKDGYKIPVYDFKGVEPFLHTTSDTIFVVNFWATWCIPCVKELPNFVKLDSIYKNKKVKVILLSMDMKSQAETQLIPFLKKRNIKSKVMLLSDMDMNSWIPKVDPSWGGSIPCTLIFNKNKRKFYPKEFTYDELETEIKNFNNN